MLTGKREMENYIHPTAIQTSLVVSVVFGDFADVPETVAQELHRANGGVVSWDLLDEQKRQKKISRAKKRLNSDATTAMTPELLAVSDPNNDIRGWLYEIRRLYES